MVHPGLATLSRANVMPRSQLTVFTRTYREKDTLQDRHWPNPVILKELGTSRVCLCNWDWAHFTWMLLRSQGEAGQWWPTPF